MHRGRTCVGLLPLTAERSQHNPWGTHGALAGWAHDRDSECPRQSWGPGVGEAIPVLPPLIVCNSTWLLLAEGKLPKHCAKRLYFFSPIKIWVLKRSSVFLHTLIWAWQPNPVFSSCMWAIPADPHVLYPSVPASPSQPKGEGGCGCHHSWWHPHSSSRGCLVGRSFLADTELCHWVLSLKCFGYWVLPQTRRREIAADLPTSSLRKT